MLQRLHVLWKQNQIFFHERMSTNCWIKINWDRYLLVFVRVISKVEKILEGSLDSIPSPSPSSSVKIQIMGRKV